MRTLVALALLVSTATEFSASAWAAKATGQAAYLQIEMGSHAGPARRIAVDVARDLVVTGGDDKTARLWSLGAGNLRQVLRPPVGADESGRVYGVAVHPQHGWVAVGGTSNTGPDSGGPSIQIHDPSSGEPVRRIDAHGGDVKRLLWSSDGSLLLAAYAGQHGVRAFDGDGREVFFDAFDGGVYALAVAPGRLAVAGLDGSLRLYEQAPTGRLPAYTELWRMQVGAQAVSLAFSPPGDALAVGYFQAGRAPDIVRLADRWVTACVPPAAVQRSTLMSVAWSRDGRFVYAGGDYPFARRNSRLLVFEPSGRSTDEIETGAPSTLTDLLTLPDGRLAFSSADGSWGVLNVATRSATTQRAQLPDLDGAGQLRVSPDGRVISWALDAGRDRVSFDLTQRVASSGTAAQTQAPRLRRGLFDVPLDWENHLQPQVNGVRVPMASDEVSRAVALFAPARDAVLGTSRALYRLAPDGAVIWRRQMNTEVRAVNVTADGRLVHAAMLDGTIRIARASDGRELLALLMLKDRRWVLWTPDGYFDAAVGADRLVGWVVNRPGGGVADYHPVARLRERFHQPRYIDLLLQTLDPELAAQRHAQEVAAELQLPHLHPPPGPAPVPLPSIAPSAAPLVALALPAVQPPQFPPILHSPLRVLSFSVANLEAEVDVEVPVSVRSESGAGALTFEVRVDGRPGELLGAALVPGADGLARGPLRLRVPAWAASVQLLAHNAHGHSEAWVLSVQARLPPPPVLGALPSVLPPLSATASPGLPSTPTALPTAPALPAAAVALPAPSVLATVRGGRLFVLTVGVSDYQRPQYNLKLAAKDAADFAQLIQRQQGKLYREVIVRPLLNADATRANMLSSLAWLARAGGRGDTYMVFLAGHGVNGSSGSYYFLTADARHEALKASTVTDREIRAALRQIPGRTLLFIDTCHAGAALGSTSGKNSELGRFVNEMSDNGVVVFAASTGRQESQENDSWGNGAFTFALLGGLGGKADTLRQGRVTYKGLDYYLSEEVQRMTKGQQTPVSLSPFGVPDFEVVRL